MGAIFVVVVGFTNGFKIHNNSLPSQQMGLDILYYSNRVSVVGTSINTFNFWVGRMVIGPELAQTIALYRVHGRVSTERDVPLSLRPGTRAGANVPGQNPLSRDVAGQNELKFFK